MGASEEGGGGRGGGGSWCSGPRSGCSDQKALQDITDEENFGEKKRKEREISGKEEREISEKEDYIKDVQGRAGACGRCGVSGLAPHHGQVKNK
jgi:hypothetical protein